MWLTVTRSFCGMCAERAAVGGDVGIPAEEGVFVEQLKSEVFVNISERMQVTQSLLDTEERIKAFERDTQRLKRLLATYAIVRCELCIASSAFVWCA